MEQLIIILAVVVAVIGGGGTTLLVRTRTRHRLTRAPDRTALRGGTTAAPGTAVPDLAEGGSAPPDAAVSPALPPAPSAPPAEKPPPSAGRLVRLRGRLARSQSALGGVLLGLLSRDRLDDETWDEIEETLITADMGVTPARQLVEELRTEVKVAGTRDAEEVRSLLRAQLLAQVGVDLDRTLHTTRHGDRPAIVLVVGVNGTGKRSEER